MRATKLRAGDSVIINTGNADGSIPSVDMPATVVCMANSINSKNFDSMVGKLPVEELEHMYDLVRKKPKRLKELVLINCEEGKLFVNVRRIKKA